MADPVTLGISIAISVGLSAASYALTPKPKLGKVDRGRSNDTRLQSVEEGAFIPLCYGRRARLAGLAFWGTPTQEHISTTPGRQSGKGLGGGGGGEPASDNYTYTKSFALLICDALPGGANGKLRKIWEDLEVIANFTGSDEINGFREAEAAGNSLANGSVRAADTQCSGGQKVSLPVFSAGCQFNAIDGPATVDVTLYYISSSSATLQVVVNNVIVTTLSLASTAGAVGTHDFTVTLPALDNYIRFQGASAALSIDRINLRVEGSDLPDDSLLPTHALDPDGTYPADLDNPSAFYNVLPEIDPDTGYQTGTIVAGGQSNFEFFTGTEDQPQSAIMVAIDGAENTPAYRGDCFIVFDNYQCKNGSPGNFSFEIDPGMSDLADVMTDLYKQVSKYRLPAKLTDDDLDMSALAGLVVETLVIDSPDGLAAMIDSLQSWYNFDVIDQGSKIVAVLRGAEESLATITEEELSAYEEGGQRPAGPVAQTFSPGVDAPGLCNVSFIDGSPGKDFHTSTVPAQRTVGTSIEPVNLDFPLGGNAEQAVAVGLRYLHQKDLERRPFEFSLGPKYSTLLPTSLVTVQLSNATHVVRLTQVQAALTGLVKAKAVPEKASIYTQARSPFYGTGHEPPPVAYPANSHLWMGDVPPFRLEDDLLGRYIAFCKRGAGAYRGTRVYKEELAGEFDPIITGTRPSMIGVVVGVLPSVSDPTVFDRGSSLIVDFYFDNETLASRAEEEILSRPVNVLAVGSGQDIEILQFADAVPSATSSPFVVRYTFTNLLRGRNNTEYAVSTHADGEPCLVLDDTVHFVREDVAEVGTLRDYKPVTIGQALVDAPVYEDFLFTGNSLRHPSPVGIRSTRNSALDILADWNRRARFGGFFGGLTIPLTDEAEVYEVEVWDDYSDPEPKRRRRIYGPAVQAVVSLDITGVDSDNTPKATPISISAQRLEPEDSYVAAELFDLDSAPLSVGVGIIDNNGLGFQDDGSGGTTYPLDWYAIAQFTGTTTFSIMERTGGVASTVFTDTVEDVPNRSIRIEIRNNTLLYFIDYENQSSLPVYTSTLHDFEGRDLRGYFFNDSYQRERRIRAGRRQFIYTAAEQVEDFGSEQSSVKVKVYQIHSLVGRSRPGMATI